MNGINRIRHRLGMSRQDLALAIGVTPVTVGRWERGEREPSSSHAWSLIHLARERRVGASLEAIYPDPAIGESI
jgi:DNA-binding XRE family transcriptional regulator